MQWAYSELFQEYAGPQIAGYLDHAFRQSQRVGALVHYSETHDNPRLAARGRAWSVLRNRLCALSGVQGGFGFTCGVEWLAQERVNVHASRGLSWGNADNIVGELAALNRLVAEHPAFFDHALVARLSDPSSPGLALLRQSAPGADAVLVVVNTDPEKPHRLTLDRTRLAPFAHPDAFFRGAVLDLLGQAPPETRLDPAGNPILHLGAGAAYCLATQAGPRGLAGETYRRKRRQAAWALEAASVFLLAETVGPCAWADLADFVAADPARFLGALAHVDCAHARGDLLGALQASAATERYRPVVEWTPGDQRRITPVPPGHWLLIRDTVPFRACVTFADNRPPRRAQSVPVGDGHAAWFSPGLAPHGGARSAAGAGAAAAMASDAQLECERYADTERELTAPVRFLAAMPAVPAPPAGPAIAASAGVATPGLASAVAPGAMPAGAPASGSARSEVHDLVLLTNGRGGMSRMAVDLGRIRSKYDALLAANLDPNWPVDRHVFVKRLRVWADAEGFITPLDERTLLRFEPGPPAVWHFRAPAGDNGFVTLRLAVGMVAGQNLVALQFERGQDDLGSKPHRESCHGVSVRVSPRMRLTVRLDIEDRNFHWETKRSGGAEHHFTNHTRTLTDRPGFEFVPDPARQLRVHADRGRYHAQPEWVENILHPVEQSRGQVPCGDAYSPGWLELPLDVGDRARVIVSAEPREPEPQSIAAALTPASPTHDWPSGLGRALEAFVARRGSGKTVVAGYPWFLDWGRDTLISARGLIAAGRHDDVREILTTFGRFERDGTLPNSIHGADASNRDTSDAPLWYALACEELAAALAPAAVAWHAPEAAPEPARALYSTAVDPRGRTVLDVLRSIATGYLRGTPNGIRADPESGLVWSPSHFTWMDTNHPAGTPRQGYPIDIQALWIRLLRQLHRLGAAPLDAIGWAERAERATAALARHFWLEGQGYLADGLWIEPGRPAHQAVVDTALRSNMLLPVSLGLVDGPRARRCVAAAARHLLVPGALRSLAPLPVTPPLPIRSADGRLLNDPVRPYWGRYEGDEDTHRKPAYHNGTAWTWTFPGFCEALARAWDFAPMAVAAARAYLGSADRLLHEGCLGQLPEIVDGDAPHTQRGCDAQAWGATEALRVWRLLEPNATGQCNHAEPDRGQTGCERR
jgi:glycogen debranching enzyme